MSLSNNIGRGPRKGQLTSRMWMFLIEKFAKNEIRLIRLLATVVSLIQLIKEMACLRPSYGADYFTTFVLFFEDYSNNCLAIVKHWDPSEIVFPTRVWTLVWTLRINFLAKFYTVWDAVILSSLVPLQWCIVLYFLFSE